MIDKPDRNLGWVWAVAVGAVVLSLIVACVAGAAAGFVAGRFAAGQGVGMWNLQDGTLPQIGGRLPRRGLQVTPAPPQNLNPNVSPNVAGAAIVRTVTAGGPAEKAGVKVGDVITRVDDVRLDGNHALVDVIGTYKPGDVVTLTLMGGGGSGLTTVKVTLGQNPNDATRAYLGVSYSQMAPNQGGSGNQGNVN